MGKYFCPECFNITVSLRYYKSDKKWHKPQGNSRFCETCKVILQEKDCLAGLKGLVRVTGGD